MRLKKKNKGFSLVELIVVMAIMAILAVTLAPTLTQYVEKSRKAADREVINSIYTTVQYALLDDTLSSAASTVNLSGGLNLNSVDSADAVTEVYIVNGKVWKANNAEVTPPATDTSYTHKDNLFIKEIYNVVGDFKLKSNDAGVKTRILITATGSNDVIVTLNYDGAGDADYTATYSDVR